MFGSLIRVHVKTLTSKMMVLGGGAFGRCLGHQSGFLMMRTLIKVVLESKLTLSTM